MHVHSTPEFEFFRHHHPLLNDLIYPLIVEVGITVVKEGLGPVDKLVEDDPVGKSVTLGRKPVLLVFLEDLRRAVGDGEAGRVLLLAHLRVVGLSEVNQLDEVVAVHHDVRGLEVKVHDLVVAEVAEGLSH